MDSPRLNVSCVGNAEFAKPANVHVAGNSTQITHISQDFNNVWRFKGVEEEGIDMKRGRALEWWMAALMGLSGSELGRWELRRTRSTLRSAAEGSTSSRVEL